MDMPQVAFDTTMGRIVIELNAEKAPKTVENFIAYVKSGQYDGTIFHRVIKDFMVQGGGFDKDMRQKATSRPNIQNEADNGLKNELGTIAMARTSDPHSAGAQFFINAKSNGFLNHTSKTMQGWGYAVFGRVVEGMDVVSKIEGVKTANFAGHGDVPTSPIIIEKAVLLTKE